MKVDGEYNTADVKADFIEEGAIEQIQEMSDHRAMVGDSNIAIMPDAHWGSGAVIGFTKPFEGRVPPDTVGVDVGCGMFATCFGEVGLDFDNEKVLKELDEAIRANVPMGFNVHDRGDYHMHNDFPYEVCQEKLATFNDNSDMTVGADYGPEYYDALLERIEYDPGRTSNSMGTLGGGNHFIELGLDSQGRLWAIIHSGSRGVGMNIAQYWSDRATKLRNVTALREFFTDEIRAHYKMYIKFNPYTVSDEDLLDWVQGGMGEDFVDYDKLKDHFEVASPKRIGEISSRLKDALDLVDSERNDALDYLDGEEAHGYIRDMIFAQTYASESRVKMAEGVRQALQDVGEYFTDYDAATAMFEDEIESVHNYIDFEDQVIRKGACRAHEGERVVIPFNMSYGTLICEGKGDESWNNSAPHGAGRAMGRRDAKRRYDPEDMTEATEGVYMSETPLDETPQAYKDPEDIEGAIGPTVEVVDRVKPFLNLKAE